MEAEPRRHEHFPPHPPSEGRSHASRFGEAAEALASAGAGAGGSLAEVQVQRLIEWAKSAKCLIAEADFEALPLVSDETGEHEVRFRGSDHRVLKRTWTGTFGMVPCWQDGCWKPASATPLEYLQRFAMHNHIFDDDVILEGVIVSDKASDLPGIVPGGASVVISQRWLIADDPERPHPTEQEITAYMNERGFEHIPGSFFGWFNEVKALLVLDAKPDNFVKTADGILPFDLLMLNLREDS